MTRYLEAEEPCSVCTRLVRFTIDEGGSVIVFLFSTSHLPDMKVSTSLAAVPQYIF